MGEEGKRERFEALYRDHEAAVRAYALRRAESAAAQDAVSETFLAAWRRFDDLPGEPLPWLYGTARKVLANQRRRSGHQSEIVQRVAAQPEPLVVDTAERVGQASAIRVALARLSDSDRETLMLVAWEGLEPGPAAAASGCSRATFAVRLYRARKRLQSELARAGANDDGVLEAT